MVFIKRRAKLIFVLMAVLIGSAWYIVKRENDYFTHLNRITNKFIGEMEKEHGFSCFSIGGSLAGNIKKVSLKFYCHEKKSIEEARELEIDSVERFCEMINSHKKIRPHLEEFPFTNERVGITVCFRNKDSKKFPPEESISLVMSCREKIFYDVEFNDHRPNQTLLEENYSEAYVKVKGTVAEKL